MRQLSGEEESGAAQLGSFLLLHTDAGGRVVWKTVSLSEQRTVKKNKVIS